MSKRSLDLSVLPETFAVCRLSGTDHLLPHLEQTSIWALIKTEAEISLVCPETIMPSTGVLENESGWTCLKVHGPFAFSETGIISTLTAVLAKAGIGVFVFSTYQTDYILVKKTELGKTIEALTKKGHRISND